MKRLLSILLIPILLLSLAACGKAPKREEDVVLSAAKTGNGSWSGKTSGAWTGSGDIYTLRSSDAPAGCTALLYGGELFFVHSEWGGTTIQRGVNTIYSFQEHTALLGIDATPEGLWCARDRYLENGGSETSLMLLSKDGELLHELHFDEIYDSEAPIFGFAADAHYLYVFSEEELIALSKQGELVGTIPMPSYAFYSLNGTDGSLYLARETEDGVDLLRPEFKSGSLELVLRLPGGSVYTGGEGSLFLLKTEDGLFRVSSSGELTPILLWEECSIPAMDLSNFIQLPDGRFYCSAGANQIPKLLAPADSDQPHVKKRLVMAGVCPPWAVQNDLTAFNLWSEDYYIEYVDYSDNGSLDADQALLRLNTMLNGDERPDLINFSTLSPDPYIAKGILYDLGVYLDEDPEISRDDLVARKVLEHKGGIYFLGGDFFMQTRIGRESNFGQSFGWTLDQYLDFESRTSSDFWTMFDMTKRDFLHSLCARYIRTGVDWDSASCDFDNPQFIAILEAAKRIRESPEDPSNKRSGYGLMWVAEGTMLVDMLMMPSFATWAEEEQTAGCRLSVVGEPTVDGSCGTDLGLSGVGIVKGGSCPEGGWAYLKYCLLHPFDNPLGLCMYKPLLMERMDRAIADPGVNFSSEDRERFLALLDAVEYTAYYDETVLSIVDQEAAAFLSGERSAEETARLIQSRVSLYVAEQS